jgi:RNA polymerase sigma-70 factor (ECF subfamily)
MRDLDQLARDARGGDRGALDDFIIAAYPDVRRLCGVLVDDAAADDLAQDTFIRVLRSLHRFRGDASARTWTLTIARNTCADEIRSRLRQRRRHDELLARRTAEVQVESATGQLEVADLIRRLDPDRREAYVLTQMLGLSYREAADVCACPPGTIHSRVARARDDLIRAYYDTPTYGRGTQAAGEADPPS